MEAMSMQKALQVAVSYDKNKDGTLAYKEWYKPDQLHFYRDAQHWLDENADGNITVRELAKGLQQGDVVISSNNYVSMTHPIGQPPAVSESVRMNLQVNTEVKTR